MPVVGYRWVIGGHGMAVFSVDFTWPQNLEGVCGQYPTVYPSSRRKGWGEIPRHLHVWVLPPCPGADDQINTFLRYSRHCPLHAVLGSTVHPQDTSYAAPAPGFKAPRMALVRARPLQQHNSAERRGSAGGQGWPGIERTGSSIDRNGPMRPSARPHTASISEQS